MPRGLRVRLPRLPNIVAGLGTLVLFFAIAAPVLTTSTAQAEQLRLRSVKISDGTASATGVIYDFSFTTYTAGPIGSVAFEVCDNYQFEPGDPCTPPGGLDAAAATLSGQTGVTDFTKHGSSTTNRLVIARPVATMVAPQPLTYEFSDIVNPDSIGTTYVRISTYPSLDGTGMETDYGTVVFATTTDIQITTEVPPYLQFCVGITIDGFNCGTATGGFVSFGELSRVQARAATSQMLASTNAPYGYSITLAGSTMTAGNNVIPAMNGGPSIPGVSQFGLNARANSNPSVGLEPDGPGLTMPTAAYNAPNNFRFQSGEIIASSGTTDDFRKLTVSYIVNRDGQQQPGRYVATISYICLANF